MAQQLPAIYLARHGETAWSISGQHTGLSDIPLTERGERNAQRLGERLRGVVFSHIYSSPLQRAWKTCELAGFAAQASVDPDLVEWDYGSYDGKRSAEIRQWSPHWQLFRDGCPGGESPAAIGARADRVLTRLRLLERNVLVFSSGHFLRVLAARWLGQEAEGGRLLYLTTASLSVIGYEHDQTDPVLRLWNDDRHVGP